MKLRVSAPDAEGRVNYWMWCPGCDDAVRADNGWTWDGNLEAPTFSPSILIRGVQWQPEFGFHKPNHLVEPGQETVCHSFLVAGVWQFLGDCTHVLAGRHVPMVDLPEWLAHERPTSVPEDQT